MHQNLGMLRVLTTDTAVVVELVTMEECDKNGYVQDVKKKHGENQLVFPVFFLVCLSVGISPLPPICSSGL